MTRDDLPTAKHLVDSGLVSAQDIRWLGRELSEADPAQEGYCSLDAERLRSKQAVECYGMWLYMLVRALKPDAILETGVQNGCSTKMILWAVHRNRSGQLFSIDSGPTSSDGSHHTAWNQTTGGIPGKNVLKGLRKYWDLTVGLTADRLLEVCERAKPVALFWHDSDHSPENVGFEFSIVKSYVRTGGLLALHDYHDQDVTLREPVYRLILPQVAPYLRVWRKVKGNVAGEGTSTGG